MQLFAEMSGHQELRSVPWVIWGHPGGASWAVHMAGLYPERTIAVFARSGGMSLRSPATQPDGTAKPEGAPALDTSAIAGIPILFVDGEKEADRIGPRVTSTMASGRAGRALGGGRRA